MCSIVSNGPNNNGPPQADRQVRPMVQINVGPSGVRALPLAAGINVVAIVLGIIPSSSSEALTFLPERRQLRFLIFAWAPN